MREVNSPIAKPAKSSHERRLPHVQTPDTTIFITFATWNRWILPDEVRRLAIDHIVHDHGVRYQLHAAVVMPDHVHALLTPQRDQHGNTFGLAEIMQSLKGSSSHSINRALGRTGRVWQREYHDRSLRMEESARQKAEYICANPVRARLVAREDDWRWLWREWIEGAIRQA